MNSVIRRGEQRRLIAGDTVSGIADGNEDCARDGVDVAPRDRPADEIALCCHNEGRDMHLRQRRRGSAVVAKSATSI